MNLKKIASRAFAATVVMAACVAPAMATPVTFADFNLRGGVANPFKYTNNTTGGGATFTVTGQIPVTFTFQTSNAYNTAGTPILAVLSFSAQTTGLVTPGTAVIGDDVSQSLKNVTFSFHPVGMPTVNLLTLGPDPTAANSTGKIKGTLGDTNVGLRGSTNLGNTVYYTSDFLNFNNTVSRGFNFSFSSVNPVLSIKKNGNANNGKGDFNNFSTSGTGTFSSDPAPLNPAVPEPAPVAAFLIGGMGLALLAFRGRKASRLTA